MTQFENADELFQLGMKHVYGDGAEQSYGKAIELITKAAEFGHVEAIYNLAIFYHYGYGVDVDLQKAYGLYLRSAELGYAKGKHLIGRFYYRGLYVKQDYQKALAWFRASEDCGDPSTLGFNKCYIGVCYAKGYGLKQDMSEAERLFALAVEEGRDHAKKLIDDLMKE